MILFKDDWHREGAIVHSETSNKTFLKVSMILKKMNVENYMFPLALLQPDLAKYDPHNLQDSSEELRLRIALESKMNPWYHFREIARVPASGSGVIPFKANRANIAMIWCFFNNIHYIAIQPRQTGKAQKLSARIKTPMGWTFMGDLKIGDVITAPDGTSTNVIGIYPQGIKPFYRITFEDGRYTDCCDDHLWRVYNPLLIENRWNVITLKDIRNSLENSLLSYMGLYIQRTQFEAEATGKYLLRIKSIEYIGQDEMQCIEVDHPDHLYITDDFIVTHNTIGACAIINHVMYLYGTNMTMQLYTKDAKLAQENVVRIKTMREALPDYLLHKRTTDTDNKEGLSYTALHNRYLTAIAQSSKEDADNLGRGMTAPVIHGDEPGFCDNIDITYPVMMLSTLTAVKNAKAAGQPHSNIFTTTAAPIDTARGRFAYQMVNNAMPFTENLYDLKDNEAAKALVKANSKNDMVNGTFSYLMLGLTHDWYEEACRLSQTSKEVNDRELLNEWKSGTDTSILDPVTIKLINNHKKEPIWTDIINNYVVRWYIPKDFVKSVAFQKKHYILGMDSSENIGRDFTTLVLIDSSDLSVVATFRCNESNTIKMGVFIAEFLIMYNNVTFIPERNSTGTAIIDVITLVFQKRRLSPFRRIYNTVVQDRDNEDMARINIDDPDMVDTSMKRHLGFRTTGKTRPYLYKNTLKKAVGMNATRIYDTVLIGELSTLSVSNGRIDHVDGAHDDMVIAYLLACWLIFEGKNLHYYGIDVRSILMSISSDGSLIDPTHRDQQIALRRQIKIYEDLIKSSPSQLIKNNHIQKLMLLRSQLDTSMTFEPVGIAKVNQDVSDFGHQLYTPQEFTNKTMIPKRTDGSMKTVLSLFY